MGKDSEVAMIRKVGESQELTTKWWESKARITCIYAMTLYKWGIVSELKTNSDICREVLNRRDRDNA